MRRRNSFALRSCSLCRQRKVRCNREKPCNHCVRSETAVCEYTIDPPRGSQPPPLIPAAENRATHSSGVHVPAIADSDQQSHGGSSPAFSSNSLVPAAITKAAATGLADTFYVHYMSEHEHQHDDDGSAAMHGVPQQTPTWIPRCVSHKTRLFGQSHWISPTMALFRDLTDMLEEGDLSKVLANLQRCKSLGRLIKARRSPPWPTVPTKELPSRDLADALVDCYLQTTETVYRVLHVPTFRKAYESLWLSGSAPEMAFVVQVKLVLAIGAATYDDHFSLRTLAIRWIHEAMTWNSSPDDFKSRLTVQGLQNYALLLIAQGMIGVGRDMVFHETGALLRIAMHMGLHRDPSRLLPRTTLYTAEMRRRLWNTIIELILQSSFDSGGPVLLSLSDFDTAPPGNYHDADLDSPDHIPPQPMTTATPCMPMIAFRSTFPQRLSIVKFLNGLPLSSLEGPYTATLSLDGTLQTGYRALTHTLRSHPRCLATLYIDLLIRRYFSALHAPFLEASLTSLPHPSKFLYSRTTALDSALRIWSTASPAGHTGPVLFSRFIHNGASFLRGGLVQSIFVIAAELRFLLLSSRDSLLPPIIRPDLLAAVEDAIAYTLRCIEAGETNVKGYVFVRLVRAQLESAQRGANEEEMARALVQAAEEASGRAREVVEGLVGSMEGADSGGGVGDGTGMEVAVDGMLNLENVTVRFPLF